MAVVIPFDRLQVSPLIIDLTVSQCLYPLQYLQILKHVARLVLVFSGRRVGKCLAALLDQGQEDCSDEYTIASCLSSTGYELRNWLIEHVWRIFKGAEVSSLPQDFAGNVVLLLRVSEVLS